LGETFARTKAIRERQKKEEKRQKQEAKRQKQEAKLQKKKTQGKGFLPSDPNALCERLELLMASKQAGNTGLRNEIVSNCDELLRQKFCLVMLTKT